MLGCWINVEWSTRLVIASGKLQHECLHALWSTLPKSNLRNILWTICVKDWCIAIFTWVIAIMDAHGGVIQHHEWWSMQEESAMFNYRVAIPHATKPHGDRTLSPENINITSAPIIPHYLALWLKLSNVVYPLWGGKMVCMFTPLAIDNVISLVILNIWGRNQD